MSVLCCQIPDFLIKLHQRRYPATTAQPLALLGPDETVCAVSALAAQCGVQPQMKPPQALMRCPDLRVQPVAMADCQAEQDALLALLAGWGLPVEEQGWGAAYVDLQAISRVRAEVRPLAVALGQEVRTALGAALQPAIGWDHGKFTSRAAAMRTAPGHLKLVDKRDERAFLAPLPITLLPLPPATVQRLKWLGITTLGEFAKLPPAAVAEQFGKAGKVAQQWAQGRDERPVRNSMRSLFEPLHISIDPPTVLIDLAVQALMAALLPDLQTMAAQLAGCRRLRLQLVFTEGDERQVEVLCLDPVSQAEVLQSLIANRLRALNWPGELSAVKIVGLEQGELPMAQLALLPEMNGDRSPVVGLVEKLKARCGAIFYQGQLVAPDHPVAERRFTFTQ